MSPAQIFQIFTNYLLLILVCSLTTSQEGLKCTEIVIAENGNNSETSQETREMSMQKLRMRRRNDCISKLHNPPCRKKSKHPGGQKT